ncbi:MAG: Gfo/Idh/MocA family protein [Armatimonadota bacterium]
MRIGIIGCGGIASEHVRGYRQCEDVQIVAAADVDLERAVKIAGSEHAYTDFHKMLENEELDAVSVCTPPKFHKEQTCASLETGIAVLCEKPLAMNATEAREMVECAKQTGKILVTAFCHRFHEPVVRAKEIVKSGQIGKITMFRNRFGGKIDMTQTWFSNRELSGGGTIPDTSVHSIDLFRYLVGEASKVCAAIHTADQRYKVEDCSAIMLQSADGAIGIIEASWTSPGSANIIEIYGTDGAIVIDYATGGLRFMIGKSGNWQEEARPIADRFVEQAKHFVSCVRGDIVPIVDGTDGLRAAEIIDSAYASASNGSGGWMRLE